MSKEEFKPTSLDDALGDEPVETPEPIEEPTIEAEQPETVAEAEETPPEPQAQPEPTPDPEPEADKPWTYHMAMDEKAKRQALEKENATLKARQAAWNYQQQQLAQKKEVPDVFDDPNAYAQAIREQTLSQVMPKIQSVQKQAAIIAHGADKLKAANDWFDTLGPHEQQAVHLKYGNSDDPYGGLIAEHSRVQIAQQLSDPAELEAFQKWKAQGNPAAQPATPAQQPQPSQVNIPPSVTATPSVGARSGPVWAGPTPLEKVLPE